MGQNDALEIIKRIVYENLSQSGKFRLFLFGRNINKNENPPYLDLGIDCGFILSPDRKIRIADEIESRVKPYNLFLIDFSNINYEVKKKLYENCEFII